MRQHSSLRKSSDDNLFHEVPAGVLKLNCEEFLNFLILNR